MFFFHFTTSFLPLAFFALFRVVFLTVTLADYLLLGDGQRIFDVDTPAHHNNQLMEIAAELNPSQRDHVLEILEVMVPYIKN